MATEFVWHEAKILEVFSCNGCTQVNIINVTELHILKWLKCKLYITYILLIKKQDVIYQKSFMVSGWTE